MLKSRPRLSPLAWAIAGFVVVLQLIAAGRYGIFRDEMYYLMCADNLAWGYVDHPPLAMAFLAAWKSIAGEGVLALRIPPALLNGFFAIGAAGLAREMRGGAGAQILAAITVALMPGILALGNFYSMNAFDVAFWILIPWIVCRLLGDGDRRWWWGLGIAVGLGLMNKYSIVFLGVGLGIGILLSPLRRELLSKNRLIGSALVLLIVLPHLIWQFANDWPTLEFMRNVREFKNADLGAAAFWGEQFLLAHPGFLPYWVAGVLGLLLMPRLRTWRPLGVAFVVVALWLTLSNAKPYYLTAAYPMVLAAGAVVVTGWLSRWRRVSRVTVFALPLLALINGLAIAPLAMSLLSVENFVTWEQTLGLRPKDMENTATGALPQHFADRFGWQELAAKTAEVFALLPEDERASTLIIASNYGECGAINYFGPDLGLPPAVSGHNSCFSWWPENLEPTVVIVIGGGRERLDESFEDVEFGGQNDSPWAMPYEGTAPIWVCRNPRRPWHELRAESRFAI